MLTLKICTRYQRKDGMWPVFIRVTHNKKLGYIKTDKMVNAKGLDRNGEVIDKFVIQTLSRKIAEYYDTLNQQDVENWSVKQVIEWLENSRKSICFSDYARQHIYKIRQPRTARNYQLALKHLECHAGTNKVMFNELTSVFLRRWMDTLSKTRRAKEMYPVCIRQIFRAAMKELNDDEAGIVRIPRNPWSKIDIPSADIPEKLAITPEQCRLFFSAPYKESPNKVPLEKLGQDVAKMVFCLAGMNTIDLYELKKTDMENWIIRYRRAKTRNIRRDGAYIEMRVPPIIRPLFEFYKASKRSEYLLSFSERYSDSDSFCANVNAGIRQLCLDMGMKRDECYSVYTFRHTWGTIAQNDCNASISEVGFAMNHSAGNTITRGYIKLDFSPAWELNEKVVDLVFFSRTQSHREEERKEDNGFDKFKKTNLMRGTAYFRGRQLAQIEDVGFSNVREIVGSLVPLLPDDIPDGCRVQFKVENLDKKQTVVYEHQKGKGF